jgi:hypothetical protein
LASNNYAVTIVATNAAILGSPFSTAFTISVGTTTSVSIPAQAAAAGFNTVVMNMDCTNVNQVSNTVDGSVVAQLYGWNQYGSAYAVGPGGWSMDTTAKVLYVNQATAFGSGFATCCSTSSAARSSPGNHAPNTGWGKIFNQGYFEIISTAAWQDGTNYAMSWMNDPTGQVFEIDICETFGDVASNIIAWSETNTNGTDGAVIPQPASTNGSPLSGNTNKYGFLWTSTYMQFYINDVAVGTQVPTTVLTRWNDRNGNFWGNYAMNAMPSGGNLAGRYLYWQTGTWVNPYTISRMTVYQ